MAPTATPHKSSEPITDTTFKAVGHEAVLNSRMVPPFD